MITQPFDIPDQKILSSTLKKINDKIYCATQFNISSQMPAQISDTLYNKQIKSDSVLLLNGDIWRYYSAEQDIFNHPTLANKTVFLQSLGYTNIKYNDMHYHISLPIWYWQREIVNKKFIPLSSNLDYGFSCLNNVTNLSRFILGHNLYLNNLLETIIFSQNLVQDQTGRLEQDLDDLYSGFDLPKFHEYKKLLPIKLEEEKHTNHMDIGIDNHPENWFYIPWKLSAHSNAYCFIVTETECEEYPYERNENLPIVTEKSFKPFQTRQLPIVLGARGHYAYLKSLGFEMMEDILPAGYDDMPTLQKIDAIVATVAKGREFVRDFYFDHLGEIEHNYELVNSTRVEDLIVQKIKATIN